jgi:hypothetical protein
MASETLIPALAAGESLAGEGPVGEGEVLDMARERPRTQRRLHRIGALTRRFGCHIAAAVDDIDVIAQPADAILGPAVATLQRNLLLLLAILAVLVAVAVYAATLPTLGFIVSLFLLIGISSFASHEFKVKTTVISAFVLLAFSWGVFIKGLELQFPFLPTFLTR